MRGATVVSKPEDSVMAKYIIDNSDTMYKGDLVTINTDGHATLVTSSDEKIAGVCEGFVGKNGESVTLTGSDYLTVDSDNETVDQTKAIVNVGRNIRIKIDADDDLSATNLGQFFDLNNSYQVDVADASDSSGALQLIEIDPDDASKGVYVIADHQFQQTDS